MTKKVSQFTAVRVVPLVSGQSSLPRSLPVRHKRAGAEGDAPFACLPRHRVNKMKQILHRGQVAHMTAQHTVLHGTVPSPVDICLRG